MQNKTNTVSLLVVFCLLLVFTSLATPKQAQAFSIGDALGAIGDALGAIGDALGLGGAGPGGIGGDPTTDEGATAGYSQGGYSPSQGGYSPAPGNNSTFGPNEGAGPLGGGNFGVTQDTQTVTVDATGGTGGAGTDGSGSGFGGDSASSEGSSYGNSGSDFINYNNLASGIDTTQGSSAKKSNRHFFTAETGATSSLTVTFSTDYGDHLEYRPSLTDGNDTMIDFGDGSEQLWVQCIDSGASTTKCHFVKDDKTAPTNSHTYPQSGRYAARVLSVPSGFGCAVVSDPEKCRQPKELAKVNFTLATSNDADDSDDTTSDEPVIHSFTGPTELDVNEEGTWTVGASDPDGGSLSYKIDWGDRGLLRKAWSSIGLSGLGGSSFVQDTTFRHSYVNEGIFTIKLTVRDEDRKLSRLTATVKVGDVDDGGELGLVAAPTSGKAPLKVNLNIKKNGSAKIDFGDGTSTALPPCQVVLGASDSLVDGLNSESQVAQGISYPASGVAAPSGGGGGSASYQSFGGGAPSGSGGGSFSYPSGGAGTTGTISNSASRPGCPDSTIIHHVYTEPGNYTIKLTGTGSSNSGETVSVAINVRSESTVVNFFSGVTNVFKNMFATAVDLFFPGLYERITERDFADLPTTNNSQYRSGTRDIDDIEAIVIDNRDDPQAGCHGTTVLYQAYVITISNEIGITDCSDGTNLLDYLTSIADNLNVYHSFVRIPPEDLAELPVYLGDARSDLGELLGSADTDDGGFTNTIDFEVKVKDQSGTVVSDWKKANVTILPTDQLFFRWDAPEYKQCLPSLADNGNYALTRYDDPFMRSGDTEDEGYNITERNGLYSVECSRSTGNTLVDASYIRVTIDDERNVDEQNGFSLSIDGAVPLKVIARRTVDLGDGDCGPKFVGRVDWGDGDVTEEPDAVTMECGNNTSVTTSHTYEEAGTYTITITLSGQRVLRQQIRVGGATSSGVRITPASGKAPLNVTLTTNNDAVNEKIKNCKYSQGFFGPSGNGLSVDWGDGTTEPSASYTEAKRNSGASCTDAVSKHTYAENGTYTVEVTSWHPGPTDAPITDWEDEATVRLSTTTANSSKLGAHPQSGPAPLSVNFTYAHTGTATLTFGDETKSVTSTCDAEEATSTDSCTVTRSHTYQNPGTYRASLIIGCLAGKNCVRTSGGSVSNVVINVEGKGGSRKGPYGNCSGASFNQAGGLTGYSTCGYGGIGGDGDRGLGGNIGGLNDNWSPENQSPTGYNAPNSGSGNRENSQSSGFGGFGNLGGFLGGLQNAATNAANALGNAVGGLLGGLLGTNTTNNQSSNKNSADPNNNPSNPNASGWFTGGQSGQNQSGGNNNSGWGGTNSVWGGSSGGGNVGGPGGPPI